MNKLIFSAVMLLFSFYTNAFKIDTHIWIGQQVINDLQDGKLTLKIGNEYLDVPVSAATREAILNNKSEYLLSTLGSDAFPDVVAGQLLIHPGGLAPGAWQTNDWLRFLFDKINDADNAHYRYLNSNKKDPNYVDRREIARVVAYGFLAHAASDVFAHTYVNQYSGDVFELTDTETVVEQRHFLLESFIGKYTPALKNHNNVALGSKWQNAGASQAYYDYIRDSLIYDDSASFQYSSQAAPHLRAIKLFKDAVNTMASDEMWTAIDSLIIRAIAYYYDIDLSQSQAEDIQKLLQQVLDEGNIVTEKLDALDIKINQSLLTVDSQIYGGLYRVNNKFKEQKHRYISLKNELETTVLQLDSKHHEAACELFLNEKLLDPTGLLKFVKETDPGLRLIKSIFGSDFNPLDPLGLIGGSKPKEPKWDHGITGTKESLLAAKSSFLGGKTFEEYEDEVLARVEGEYGDLEWEHSEQYEQLLKETRDELHRIKTRLDLIDTAVVDLSQGDKITVTLASQGGGISDGRGHAFCKKVTGALFNNVIKLTNKKNSLAKKLVDGEAELKNTIPDLQRELNSAMTSIIEVKAAIQALNLTARETTSPVQSLLKNWAKDIDEANSEYVKAASQAIVNTINPNASAMEPLTYWLTCYQPQLIGVASQISGCNTMENISNIKVALSNVTTIIAEAGSLSAALGAPHLKEIEELEQKLLDAMKEKLIERLTKEFIGKLPKPYQEFIELQNKPVTDALINQVFTRTAPGKSLVIIDNFAQKLRDEMAVTNGQFNPQTFTVVANAVTLTKLSLLDEQGIAQLYQHIGLPKDPNVRDNLVVDSFANIDGNHQWLDVSPPLPRGDKNYTQSSWTKYSSAHIFSLWKEPVRNTLFRKLFVGPLSPALHQQGAMSGSYPYQTCYLNPFPSGVDDKTCTAVWQIPTLSITLL
ncbi:zinc dependent phospholipase C family protein [Pseudoalteromonas luteoviolacea]|uniref:zinc dependent phospholipase C family protein n=1 Tax=Pseudoalteromonas luteoviolacea TaxID=43657 RepID=UPI001B3721A4|nr:zinc dependent phospholipase C family protein [Pseudoalteromonas luteoviolacea]MBQ4835231.1 zinc dependent phospholipase C family protein [Pseudoalteromonas luteoviolacea]